VKTFRHAGHEWRIVIDLPMASRIRSLLTVNLFKVFDDLEPFSFEHHESPRGAHLPEMFPSPVRGLSAMTRRIATKIVRGLGARRYTMDQIWVASRQLGRMALAAWYDSHRFGERGRNNSHSRSGRG